MVSPTRSVLLATAAIWLAAASTALAASEFEAEKFPVTVTGATEGSQTMGVEDGYSLTCSEAKLSGISNQPAETLTLTPEYNSCKFAGISATVAVNGCTYVLHTGSESGEKFEGTMDISCPAGKTIVVTIATCEIQIPGQSSLGKVEYTNNPSASPKPTITAKLSLTGIKYIKAKDGFLCPLTGTGEKSEGTLSGSYVLSGKDSTGEADGMQDGKKAETSLCKDKKPDAKTGCNQTYDSTNFEASSVGSTYLFMEQSTVVCAKSKVTGATKVKQGAPLPLEGLAVTFSDCKRDTPSEDCGTVTMTNKPTGSMIAMSPTLALGDGFITTPMTIFIECAPGGKVGLKCTYSSSAISFRLYGGAPATLAGFYLPFKSAGAGGEVACSSEMSWYSSYSVSTPNQVWMYKPG